MKYINPIAFACKNLGQYQNWAQNWKSMQLGWYIVETLENQAKECKGFFEHDSNNFNSPKNMMGQLTSYTFHNYH